MATAEQIHETFIRPLERVLGEPRWKGVDAEAVYEALVGDLARFSPATLDAAAKHLRSTNVHFPKVAECVEACWKAQPPAPAATAPKNPRDVSWELYVAAVRRVRSDDAMARRADREGWLAGLIEFTGDHQRLPSQREIAALQAQAAEADRKTHVPGSADLTESLRKFRKAMLDRAHRDVFRGGEERRHAA